MAAYSNSIAVESPQTTEQSKKIRCCYINRTRQFQVIRITNVQFFERTVLPGEQCIFEADQQAELEVYTHTYVSAILTQRIVCDRLVVLDASYS
jgi:hypothetical protein